MRNVISRLTASTVLGWLGLIALIGYGAGCAGAAGLPADSQAVPPILAGLPSLPGDGFPSRDVSAEQQEIVLGKDTSQRGGTANDIGDSIELLSVPGELAFAMYSFAAGGDPLVSLTLHTTPLLGGEYWVGLSDYGAGSWLLDGPVTSATVDYDLAGGDWVSGGGMFHFLVVVYGGDAMTIEQSTVTTDVDDPPARINYLEHAGLFLNASCMPCHSGGSAVAGVILDNYVDAQADAADALSKILGDHPSALDAADKQMFQDWVDGGAPWRETAVTYDGDMRPQVFEPVCMTCHSSSLSGGARNGAPTSVNYDTYAAALPKADRGNTRAQAGTMPPSLSGLSLTAEQLATFQAWLNDGTPES